jgi:hypothetical protein
VGILAQKNCLNNNTRDLPHAMQLNAVQAVKDVFCKKASRKNWLKENLSQNVIILIRLLVLLLWQTYRDILY